MPRHDYKPGDKLRWTSAFLRWIQDFSKSSADLRFTVVECHCGLCKSGYVAVEDLLDDVPRHIAVGNVEAHDAKTT